MSFVTNIHPNKLNPIVSGTTTLAAGTSTEVGAFAGFTNVGGNTPRVVYSREALGVGGIGSISWTRVGDDLVFLSDDNTEVSVLNYAIFGPPTA